MTDIPRDPEGVEAMTSSLPLRADSLGGVIVSIILSWTRIFSRFCGWESVSSTDRGITTFQHVRREFLRDEYGFHPSSCRTISPSSEIVSQRSWSSWNRRKNRTSAHLRLRDA